MNRSPLIEIQQKLRESRRSTLNLIRDIDEASALNHPRLDAWSIKEHVTHLVAVEESIIHFAHRILNEDCPVSPLCYEIAFNQEAWNNREVAERASYTWSEAIKALERTHQDLLKLIQKIPEKALNRVGSHPIWGDPVTLASILRTPYRHERGHRDEIAVLSTIEPRPK